MPVRSEFFPLTGGLNLVDPAMAIKPGQMLVGINYMQDMRGGYQRGPGYERYDGHTRASEATYKRLDFDAGQNAPSAGSCSDATHTRPGACMLDGDTWTNGDTITGGTSSATGILLKVTVSSGSWAGNDAAGELVLTEISGTFQDNETLSVGATTIATTDGTATAAASADSDYDTMSQDAIETTRNLTSAVPGTGSILGVWVYRNQTYAIRDKDFLAADTDEFSNAYGSDNTRALMYRATSSGWTAEHLGYKMNYDAGAVEPSHNDYLVGVTSGAGGQLSGSHTTSGSFAGSDAAGHIYFYEGTVSGTWQNNETIRLQKVDTITVSVGGSGYTSAVVTVEDPSTGRTATATATISGGAVSAITVTDGGSGYSSAPSITIAGDGSGATATSSTTNVTIATVDAQPTGEGSVCFPLRLASGGRWAFLNHNFTGHESAASMFACNANNHAFSFDSNGKYRPVLTGMTTDHPTYMAQHKNHLFLSFPNGSLQHSSISDPFDWSPVTGAGEIVVGFDVTDLQVLQGDVLAVFSKVRTWLLYGTSSADWNFKQFAAETGAKARTATVLGDDLYFMNDLGVTSLMATQAHGDFISAAHSQLVQPYLAGRKANVVGVTTMKESNQLLILFDDATALMGTFDGRKIIGWTQSSYKHTPSTVINACGACSAVDGDLIMGGDTDGMVHRFGVGNSFDGNPIESFMRLAFNHFKSPGYKKRFRKLKIDLDSTDAITLNYLIDLDYANSDVPTAESFSASVRSGGAWWNTENWDTFNWSQDAVAVAEANINGTGTNMGILIYHSTAYDQPHTLQGITVNYSIRGLDR